MPCLPLPCTVFCVRFCKTSPSLHDVPVLSFVMRCGVVFRIPALLWPPVPAAHFGCREHVVHAVCDVSGSCHHYRTRFHGCHSRLFALVVFNRIVLSLRVVRLPPEFGHCSTERVRAHPQAFMTTLTIDCACVETHHRRCSFDKHGCTEVCIIENGIHLFSGLEPAVPRVQQSALLSNTRERHFYLAPDLCSST